MRVCNVHHSLKPPACSCVSIRLICLIAALAIFSVSANATVTQGISTAVSFSDFAPCVNGGTGETVDFSGRIHTLSTMIMNNNNMTMLFVQNFQELTGTGETTGLTYHANGTSSQSFTMSMQNPQLDQTFNLIEHYVAPGQGNNFAVHLTAHITVANGTETVGFLNFRVDYN